MCTHTMACRSKERGNICVYEEGEGDNHTTEVHQYGLAGSVTQSRSLAILCPAARLPGGPNPQAWSLTLVRTWVEIKGQTKGGGYMKLT